MLNRGDKNRDGFLTTDELVALVDTGLRVPPQANVIVRRSDDLAPLIADLKLPAATHNQALAILKDPLNLSDPFGDPRYPAMRTLLNDEDYENFVAAAARLRASVHGVIGGVVGGVWGGIVD